MTASSDTARKLREVIARLEAAKEGSRELDYAIEEYLYPGKVGDAELPRDFGFVGGAPPIQGYALEFTTSIDAALTLVPYNCPGWIVNGASGEGSGVAEVYVRGPKLEPKLEPCVSEAATPALALCIAALKARTKTKEGEG